MVLKALVPFVVCAALINGTSALAADYRAGEFLTLDLPKALLSPSPIGPEAHFEPFPVEANSDPVAKALPAAEPAVPVAVAMTPAVPSPRIRVVRFADKPHGAARTQLAHRHGNPMDAQAMDTRIQTWPCKPGSGGICNWK
jgi:hypothetical protein